jgi:type I restriction enzyme S subunit
MKPAQLIAYFDRISDAPDAIPRLRQFILELAVRGKLVDRGPKDEPVSGLLKRIQGEKDRRTKEGLMKKQAPLPEVRPDETWFNIPASWCWVRLGTITQVLMGQSPPGDTYNKTGEGIPLINGPVEFTEGPFAKTVINQYTTAPTNLCEEGDLLLCVRGSTTGRTNIAGFRACIGRGVAAIRPFFADQYVRLFIWRMRASIIAMGRGIAFPSVSRRQIEELPVPLPPLAEQHRIVAKVDELMELCDRVEAAQEERESQRDRLTAASLHRLNNGTNTDAFREHARFYLNHFPKLAVRPEQIKQLRQTILTLAVRGQLLRQDPNDERASELLKRIQVEKTRLMNQGKIRKQTPQPEIEPASIPFSLPKSWIWARLGDVIHLVSGQHLQPGEYSGQKEGGLPYITGPADFGPNGLVITRQAVEKAIAKKDQILLTVKGAGVGKTAICDLPEVAISRQLMAITAIGWNQRFLLLTTHRLAAALIESARSLIPGISRGDVDQFIFPLPPLAEQHRIVAKVDELMALCDELETQLTTTQTESHRLLETVLHHALNDNLQIA